MRIVRTALAQRIAAALADGPVVLVAGAGYGKSSALEQALAHAGIASAWISCTESDRDGAWLLEHAAATIARAVPGAALTPPAAPDPAAAAAELRAGLERLLVDPFAIVLDDAEHLAGAPEAEAVAAALLGAGARKGTDPFLAGALASRRALTLAPLRRPTFGAAELAMAPAEVAAVLRAAEDREPDPDRLDAVLAATEGWPLGVAIAATAGGGAAGLGPRSRAALLRYIREEVLDRLPGRLRGDAIEAALPDEIDAPLAAALGLDSRRLLEAERLGLFLRADGAGGFRFHPLFRALALERFEAERSPAERQAVHARLAAALASGGRSLEAVGHWLDAGDHAQALAELERTGQRGVAPARSAPVAMRAALARLPADVRTLPGTLLLEGSLAWGTNRYNAAIEPLRDAAAGYGAAGEPVREWLARFLLADALFESGRFERCGEACEGFEATGAEAPQAPDAATIAAIGLAAEGRFDEADALWVAASAHPGESVIAPLLPAFRAVFLELPAGRLDAALDQARSAVRGLEAGEDYFRLLPFAHWHVARVHDERGEDAEALAAARRADAAAARAGVEEQLGPFLGRYRAGYLARAGDVAAAEIELARAAAQPFDGWRTIELELARTAIGAARSDEQLVLEAAGAATALLAICPRFERARAAALLAPALAAVGHAGRAHELVVDASTARLLVIRAWLRDGAGDRDGALADLTAAWSAAAPQPAHLVRREWPRLERLLWHAAEVAALDPDAVVAAIAAAGIDVDSVLALTEHPAAAVRRAAATALAGVGHPDVPARLAELAGDPDPQVAAAAGAAARRTERESPPLAIELLGGFGIRHGRWRVDAAAWGRPIAARLVRLLLVRRDEVVAEDELLEALWPELSPASGRRSLHVAVNRARHVLDPQGASDSRLARVGGGYRLALAASDSVDVDHFEAAATAALAERGDARRPLLVRAAAAWSGMPLPEERYADWAAAWRERLVDRYAEVLGALTRVCAADGDHAGAVDAARRRVALDPLDEAGQRDLMTAYARGGRRAHALRQYLTCRRALVDALGVEPAVATTQLHARILAGETV